MKYKFKLIINKKIILTKQDKFNHEIYVLIKLKYCKLIPKTNQLLFKFFEFQFVFLIDLLYNLNYLCNLEQIYQ